MGDLVAALHSILPAEALAVEMVEGDEDLTGALWPEELAAIEGAAEGRRREFAAGRACARRALEGLGVPPGPLPAGADGAPVWPEGVVGSITHKGRYRAAAVALRRDLAGLGIDAELDAPLPAGVLESIASPTELDEVERLLAARPGTAWDRLLFSAKEAALKAVHPLGLGLTGVRSIDVRLDPDACTFHAAPGRVQWPLGGAWVARADLILAAAQRRDRAGSPA